jgi:hypothetical protein
VLIAGGVLTLFRRAPFSVPSPWILVCAVAAWPQRSPVTV